MTNKYLDYCINCGKELNQIAKWAKTKRCCSCNTKGKRNPMYGTHRYGKNAPNYKNGKPRCIECGERTKDRHAKMCQKCYIKTLRGKNHPNYIDGIDRKYPIEFKLLRIEIRQRDHYKCRICSKYGIEIHHIDYNKYNSKKKII